MSWTPTAGATARRSFAPRSTTPPRPTHIHFGDGRVLEGGSVKHCHNLRVGDITGAQFGLMNLPNCTLESWSVGGRTTLTVFGASGGILFHRCVVGSSINVKIPEHFTLDDCDDPEPGDPHPLFGLFREWGLQPTLRSLSLPEMTSFVPKDHGWVNGPDVNAVIAKPTDSHPPVSTKDGIPLWLIGLRDRRPNHVIVHNNWHKATTACMRSLNAALQQLSRAA